MISLQKWSILTPLQKLPKNVGDFGNLIVAKGFINLPKVQIIAKSGHTAFCLPHLTKSFVNLKVILCEGKLPKWDASN